MSEPFQFMMGKYAAVVPADLYYSRNHFWCRVVAGKNRFGFSSYAIKLMQDVYFLDWQVNAGDKVALLEQIGHIETSKAVSDLFAPIEGTLLGFNPEVLADPSAINVDGYDKGWLFEMDGGIDSLMDANAYYGFLAENWEKAQRMLKGKINAGDD
ncbi:MAG: glycine cleavage system protein H [Planctomycetes bacterium]|nr:glycine cleavage system protein H [Planctomycetota bacterium]NBY01095.1 glycine cleavage system protein H [Planctomycetota bacterium]